MHERAWRLALLGALSAGCADAAFYRDDTDFEPVFGPELSIGLAGAPVELFGPPTEPTFTEAFATLSTSGFDTFFPLFVLSETPDESTYSGHLPHFYSSRVYDVGDGRSCTLPQNPYAAAAATGLQIIFPGEVLVADQDLSQPLDEAVLMSRLAAQEQDCWSNHMPIRAISSLDEPILRHVVQGYVEAPQLDLANVGTFNGLARGIGRPVMLIEGPGPYSFEQAGLPEEDVALLTGEFEAALPDVAQSANLFGFNLYPVPDGPITEPGAYVRRARAAQPTAELVSVLQGMSFARISDGEQTGRAPTEDEIRFMAVDSVASGADHLYWYGASSLELDDPRDAALWSDITLVASELANVREATQGEMVHVSAPPTLGVRAHRWDGETVIFLAHRGDDTVDYELTVPGDVSVLVNSTGAFADFDRGTLTLTLQPTTATVVILR